MTLPDDQIKTLVLQQGLADEKALTEAAKLAKETKIPLAEALEKKGFLTNEQIGQVTANFLKVPFVTLSKLAVPEEIVRTLPISVSRRKKAVVFARDKDGIKIAMAEPSDQTFLSMVARKTGARCLPYYATQEDIEQVLDAYKQDLQAAINNLLGAYSRGVGGDIPLAKIVDHLIYSAYQDRASDIHIEPERDASLIRFRIDGVLQDVLKLPLALHDRLVTRIKVLSNLRTDEHLSAQDGKMRLELTEEDLDIRVSIIPITDGEKAVLRLLSSKSREYTLADLGLGGQDLAKVTKAMNNSDGMILSTGPTGSGKTTTIYAILRILNTREKNITTIEDPVEYKIKGANQIQVNPKTNLTFASGLRSILRQDPNIIFVGEIRDDETAGIAVNAALTGHLVLSTLHTNDAATTIPRLIDMKIEPYLVASTVTVIIAQRLVRKICQYCKVELSIEAEELLKNFPSELVVKYFKNASPGAKLKVFRGKGCRMCRGLGYSGRSGLFELLEISKQIRKLILEKSDASEIEKQARQEGMQTMLEDGLAKVAQGQTTIEEVLRVTKVEFSEMP